MVLSIPTVAISLLSSSITNFFVAGVGIWTVTFLVRYHGMTIATASSSLVLFAIGAVAGAVGGGVLGDRLVARGILAGRIYVAGAAQVLGVVLLLPAFATRSTPLMLVLFAVGAATLTMPNPPLSAVRADVLHPDLRGRAASAQSLATVISTAASPLLFGVLSDALNLRAAFLLIVPWMGLGGVILWLLGPRHLAADQARMRSQLAGGEMPA